jgi:hypothetical protein
VELGRVTSRSPHQSSMSLASTRRLAFSMASTSSSQSSGSQPRNARRADVSTVFRHAWSPAVGSIANFQPTHSNFQLHPTTIPALSGPWAPVSRSNGLGGRGPDRAGSGRGDDLRMSNPSKNDLLRKPAKIRRRVPQPLGERKGASGLERWLKACVATMLE